MATKMKPVDPTGANADAETYVSLLSELDGSLKAERAAHKRLMTLVRKIEAKDELRASPAR